MGTTFNYTNNDETSYFDIDVNLNSTKYAKLNYGLRGKILNAKTANDRLYLTIDMQFNLQDFTYEGTEITDLSVIIKPLHLVVGADSWLGDIDVMSYDEHNLKNKGIDVKKLYRLLVSDIREHAQFISHKIS